MLQTEEQIPHRLTPFRNDKGSFGRVALIGQAGLVPPESVFATNSSSQPSTRFQPSPWALAWSRLPAKPSCVTRTSVPVPDFLGPLGCRAFTVWGSSSHRTIVFCLPV